MNVKQFDPFQISQDYAAVSLRAAEMILHRVRTKPNLLLCAPGGSTPARTYEILADKRKQSPEIFKQLRIVKLDEWGGIPMNDPGSCETQLQKQLIQPLGIAPDRYFSFTSSSNLPYAEAEKMRSQFADIMPIDLCMLGLGINGHIGMNEPAPALQPWTHVAQLTEVSLKHPMLAHSRVRPTYGITLGMAEILGSREILLLASGASKRDGLQKMIKREISTNFPASFLWLHSNWTFLCDREAATA